MAEGQPLTVGGFPPDGLTVAGIRFCPPAAAACLLTSHFPVQNPFPNPHPRGVQGWGQRAETQPGAPERPLGTDFRAGGRGTRWLFQRRSSGLVLLRSPYEGPEKQICVIKTCILFFFAMFSKMNTNDLNSK